ncbi:unnamed protein product, partial [Clonostachys rhizophaga]
MIVEYHRHQLKSGKPTNELLQSKVHPGINRRLQGIVEGTSFSIIGTSGCETTVSLLKLCTDSLPSFDGYCISGSKDLTG